MAKLNLQAFDWTEFTDKERLFCYEYPLDKNATKAAERAGYSSRSAAKIGWELLQKPRIKDRVDELMLGTFTRLELSRDLIIRELMALALVDIGDVFDEKGNVRPVSEIPEQTRRAISSLDIDELFEGKGDERTQVGLSKKLRLHDKVKALELLGKYLKMFTDKVELNTRPKVYRRDMTGRTTPGEAS